MTHLIYFFIMNSLVKKLSKYASENGLSERTLCSKIGIDISHFSRWKRNLSNAPDPRKIANKIVYERIAQLLNIPLEEVIAHIIFPVSDETHEKLFLRIAQRDLKASPVGKKLYLIGYNSVECEEVLDFVIDFMKSYKKRIKKLDWIEP